MLLGDEIRMQQVLLILLKETLDNNIYEGTIIVSASYDGTILTITVSNEQKQTGQLNTRRNRNVNFSGYLG